MSEPIIFREILQQHQALSQRGWAIVFVALGVFFTGFGLAMFINGAWPVIGFLGVEIGALYVGYRVMTGRARRQEEVIGTVKASADHSSNDQNEGMPPCGSLCNLITPLKSASRSIV